MDARVFDSASDATLSGNVLDCVALRDWQAKSNCPKFNPGKYLSDCEATNGAFPNTAKCKQAGAAAVSCLVAQPSPGCTASGGVDETTPPACDAAEQALLNCGQ